MALNFKEFFIQGAYDYRSYPNDPQATSEIVENTIDEEIIDVTEVNGDFFTASCSAAAKADDDLSTVVTGVCICICYSLEMDSLFIIIYKALVCKLCPKCSLTIVKTIKTSKTTRTHLFGGLTE